MSYYSQPVSKTKAEVILSELLTVQKITNNKNLTIRNMKDGEFNCWGFTAYAYNWLDNLEWFEVNEMEYCLGKFTREIKRPKTGDIVVFRDCDGELIHTAILTDLSKNKIIHKPGYLRLEVNTIDNTTAAIYDDTETVEFKRPLKNKKFNFNRFANSEYSYDMGWDD